jgi:two-component system LytT family response regulator
MPLDRIRAIIVDDEPLAREGIRIRLERQPDVEVVGEFGHAGPALDFLRAEPVDLVFLDVQMPGATGFDLLERLGRDDAPAVIFVTAFAEHAVEAFRVRALDYLLKPVDDQRFRDALDAARASLRRDREGELGRRLRSVLEELQATPPAPPPAGRRAVDRIAVEASGKIRFVATDDIDWAEADGDYVRLHAGRESHLVRSTLSELHAQLDPARFARIHRSTVVQVDRIREMEPLFHGEYSVLLKDGTKLKLSRGYRAAVERLLGSL